MDKSRQYIQMCKTSKEIQSKWQQVTGDYFVDINYRVSFWTNQSSDSYKMKDGFKIENGKKVIRIEKFFWLPSLEQLIELAQVKGKSFRDTSFEFFEWCRKDYAQRSTPANAIFGSAEQLWLSYVMERSFSKKWKQNGWGKIQEHLP